MNKISKRKFIISDKILILTEKSIKSCIFNFIPYLNLSNLGRLDIGFFKIRSASGSVAGNGNGEW